MRGCKMKKFQNNRSSLSDCFGKLIETSMHVFLELVLRVDSSEGFLTFQLTFRLPG